MSSYILKKEMEQVCFLSVSLLDSGLTLPRSVISTDSFSRGPFWLRSVFNHRDASQLPEGTRLHFETAVKPEGARFPPSWGRRGAVALPHPSPTLQAQALSMGPFDLGEMEVGRQTGQRELGRVSTS